MELTILSGAVNLVNFGGLFWSIEYFVFYDEKWLFLHSYVHMLVYRCTFSMDV